MTRSAANGLRRAAAVCGLLAAVPTAAEERETLRLVFIAYENPQQLVENVEPVVEYLEATLGVEVEHFAATDYAGVVEALRNGSADAGFMGPLQSVMARRYAGAYPILGEVYSGSATYVSRIFVRRDSGIEGLEDLAGRTIAFVDPMSSSGYLYPLDIFIRAGLVGGREEVEGFFRKTYFAGGDEPALRAVLNRFVDAAGVGQYAYSLLRPAERDQVRWIAESQPIPSHCVVVREGLRQGLVEGLRRALLALNDGSRRDLLKSLYSVDGYVAVSPETYSEVERLARRHGFLTDGER